MKPSIKIHGVKQLEIKLRHTADRVADSARKTMHRGAANILKEAQLNAPVDEHNLEKSLRIERTTGIRGRLELTIVMGGFVGNVNVDRYAVEVHEHYSSMGVGPGTQAKRLANPGRYIGEKFLERAAKDGEAKLLAAMISTVKKEWKI